MITWVAFRPGDRELGEVEAPDLETAKLRAWARWSTSVERVQSRASWEIARQERAVPPTRRVKEEDDETDVA